MLVQWLLFVLVIVSSALHAVGVAIGNEVFVSSPGNVIVCVVFDANA